MSATTAPVSNLDALNAQQTPTKTLGSDSVSRDDFLRLLIAQLKNQDPMNPVENQEFVAQLATFSSLEQQTNQTQLLQKLVDSSNLSNASEAMSMIGKDVVVKENRFYFQPGDKQEFIYDAPQAGNAVVQVATDTGQVVFTDVVSADSPGQHSYQFTGTNAQGQSLPPGIYTITVGATTDEKGNQTSYSTYLRGPVDGVTFINGQPALTVNGQPIPLSSVQSVFERG